MGLNSPEHQNYVRILLAVTTFGPHSRTILRIATETRPTRNNNHIAGGRLYYNYSVWHDR